MGKRRLPSYKRIDPYRIQVGEGIIFVDHQLESTLSPAALSQVQEAARLPHSRVVVMPDIHSGYGLPIGGVLASLNSISAEAVGVDINCGVRLLSLNCSLREVDLSRLLQRFLQAVPAGVGEKNRILEGKKAATHFKGVLEMGASYVVEELGFGREEDLFCIEDQGRLPTRDHVLKQIISSFSREDLQTFFQQLGTLGSGNHFIEVQEVAEVFDEERAKAFGIQDGCSLIMLHTGSRGFGNTLAQNYIKLFKKKAREYGLGDYRLSALPISSPPGEEYFYAMNAAANYAFANRQLMTSLLCEAVRDFLKKEVQAVTIYDVAHNIAKMEYHDADTYCLHRKGATRAFPRGHPDLLHGVFKEYGHPALIPGSMGTLSFLVTGTERAMKESFGTVSHGAGRVISRRQAKKTIDKAAFNRFKNTHPTLSGSGDSLLDEAPMAYKDSSAVISVLVGAGLIEPVLSLRPMATLKG